jgi:hypothetical protein
VKHLLMGVETEYAVAALGVGGDWVSPDQLCQRFMAELVRSEVHLPDATSAGVFLGNGGRLYIDHGAHPEFCTPECANPWETLRFVRAGDRLVESVTQRVATANPDLPQLVVMRSNVDYSGFGTGWGCHESYLHTTNPRRLPGYLIPHFVSRVIYTGAGGFDPVRPGLEFTLSPRVSLLKQAVSAASTHSRGIFHVKDEPHTGSKYHRLHVLCGESTCSDVATVLKIGTTALILELVNQGARPGAAVSPASPLDALRAFAADPSCTARVESTRGSSLTAIEIQRHYLDRVERADAEGRFPDWATPLCRLWRRVLDLLEGAPESVSSVLDWAIKWSLFRDWLEGSASQERIARWSEALRHEELESVDGGEEDPSQLRFHFLSGRSRHSRLFEFVDRETPVRVPPSPPAGWGTEEHRELTKLRQGALEADLRFGQLGEAGLFSRLERDGVVSHKLTEDAEIEAARAGGPSTARGRVRGALVRRHGGVGVRGDHLGYSCDWKGVQAATGKRVDLSDPFTKSARWRKRKVARAKRE